VNNSARTRCNKTPRNGVGVPYIRSMKMHSTIYIFRAGERDKLAVDESVERNSPLPPNSNEFSRSMENENI